MGIESDQLVYDYLSRVGDLAQQRQLPASDRMRLVSTLRNEIDRRRATHGEESPAAVRGILGALGTPDKVVERAGGPGEAPPAPAPVPEPRRGERPGKGSGARIPGRRPADGPAPDGPAPARRGSAPEPRTSAPGGSAPGRTLFGRLKPTKPTKPTKPAKPTKPTEPAKPTKPTEPASVRPASPDAATTGPAAPAGPVGPGGGGDSLGTGALGVDDGAADWWRVDAAAGLPGFVGGVERPDLFTPPVPDDEEEDEGEGEEDTAPGKRRRLARVLRRRRPAAPAAVPEAEPQPEAAPASRLRLANPFVLLAALLLIGGAVFGSLVALAAGWLIAYASRRLTPGEAKAAVLVIPGLAVASGVVWLWGRVEGRWGAPVVAGGEAMGAAVSETWPWVLRGAAVASALFLLWRARRR
ncbi:hypothetical protein [Streptomyces sp. NPDC002057]|uniref:hypothetical protein n=1 Tax=Streptomyces sp. NPDC002057 TaxID=3154664 RepID=UPI00331AF856